MAFMLWKGKNALFQDDYKEFVLAIVVESKLGKAVNWATFTKEKNIE
jgi:hypothetical protein